MRPAAAACLVVLLPGLASAQDKSDWEIRNEERLWREESVTLPPYPARERLVAVDAGAQEFSFYIDPATVSVGKDGVVRYGLLARSTGGAENVRFEGLRCATSEYRIYAVGRPDGSWSARANEWRAFDRGGRNLHIALSRNYFCPNRESVSSTNEAVAALKQGGHPAARLEFR